MKQDTFINVAQRLSFEGSGDKAARFLTNGDLTNETLWKKFVQVFRDQEDGANLGWRGEYWGKMMRGAVMVYEYSHDPELYRVMTDTVRDLLTVSEADGRVSSYTRETELHAWDLWCRKYVLLGLEYYYEICTDDELKAQIIPFLCGCADAILAKVGPEEGKRTIHETGESWGALNSSSILEPMVRLHRLTGEKRYLDFAEHIIEMGGSSIANIFELAYKNELYPYQYGVAKAYEMISCFEGLIEYYMVTGNEKYKVAAVNFGLALIDSDVSVIGSLGATHELLDHAKARQTAKTDVVRQETCVTVTWMKFCARLLKLTGDVRFADQIEQAFFNAYRGALNTEGRTYEEYLYNKMIVRLGLDHYVDTILPFDSYSPLTPGRRGRQIGGQQVLPDRSFYGCCACIGAAGVGSYLCQAVLGDGEGVVVNFFETGEVECLCGEQTVRVNMRTRYPMSGSVKLHITKSGAAPVVCRIRIPEWSQELFILDRPYQKENGYAVVALEECETEINVILNMNLRIVKPVEWDTDVVYTDRSLTTATAYRAGRMEIRHEREDDAYVSFARGPVTLAADSRMGKDAASKFTFRTLDGMPIYRLADTKNCLPDVEPLVHCLFTDADGKEVSLIDYGSAGRDWNSVMTAWLPIEL